MADFKFKLYQTNDTGYKCGLLAEPTKFLKAIFRDEEDAKNYLAWLKANDTLHTFIVEKDAPIKK